jgi:hypothetical protein
VPGGKILARIQRKGGKSKKKPKESVTKLEKNAANILLH